MNIKVKKFLEKNRIKYTVSDDAPRSASLGDIGNTIADIVIARLDKRTTQSPDDLAKVRAALHRACVWDTEGAEYYREALAILDKMGGEK